MYFQKDHLGPGLHTYLKAEENGVGLDVQLLILEAGREAEFLEPEKESAFLLFCGDVTFSYEGLAREASRTSEFTGEASCLHVCKGVPVRLRARFRSEVYIQKAYNGAAFPAVFYGPADIQVQRAGASELEGTMRRDIKTVFDYENAPCSNMVVGEVLNFPGKWSSYPPHHHPQPEVYFYRFDKPQGFGVGFANGEVFKTGHNGFLQITGGFHSQAAAPGYALCYVWGIRHLPGDPWLKTRIDDPEHTWMLAPGAKFLEERA